MNTTTLERLPTMAAVVLVFLIVGACAIRLGGDEGPSSSASSADQLSDALPTKLAKCRSVTYDQQQALSECRSVWAEKGRQFFGQKTPSTVEEAPQGGLFVAKDESRLSPGYTSISPSGKE